METKITDSRKTIVAHYDSHEQAENAVIRLQQNGYDMKQFSIIAVDLYTAEKVLGYFSISDRMKHWAAIGTFYSGFWGLLFGFSTYSIPIIGPSLIQGWVGAIIAGLALGVIGGFISAVAAALYGLISRQKKVKYQTDVKAGKYLLVAEGHDFKVEHVLEILKLHIPKEKYNARNLRTDYTEMESKR